MPNTSLRVSTNVQQLLRSVIAVVVVTREEVLQACGPGTPANSTFDLTHVVFEPFSLSAPLAG